jgi:hypothetical protein
MKKLIYATLAAFLLSLTPLVPDAQAAAETGLKSAPAAPQKAPEKKKEKKKEKKERKKEKKKQKKAAKAAKRSKHLA